MIRLSESKMFSSLILCFDFNELSWEGRVIKMFYATSNRAKQNSYLFKFIHKHHHSSHMKENLKCFNVLTVEFRIFYSRVNI
jgi:hypothetical protein